VADVIVCCVASLPSGCDIDDEMNSEALFRKNYELYEAAKRRGETEEVGPFALVSLLQIHLISGVSAPKDREANVRVMQSHLGPMFSETNVREMYDRLRKDAGIE